MKIDYPRADITRCLISTPAYITGAIKTDGYYLMEASQYQTSASYSPFENERIFKHYIELAFLTPVDDEPLIIPNYSPTAEIFCSILSVFYGKRFDSHGLIQQHRRTHVPINTNGNRIYNKNLCFNSNEQRADYSFPLKLSEIEKLRRVIIQNSGDQKDAYKTFIYAAKFYAQSLRQVEESPEIAFLSLITVAEILSSYFNYPIDEVIDDDSKKLLQNLRAIKPDGAKMARQVSKRLSAISGAVCKFIIDCLDDDFFHRGEATAMYNRLPKQDIQQRIKAAYNMRSQFVHAGKFQSNWMSVNYLNNNEEIVSGDPVIEDPETQKMIKRSPTFIGMERIVRYTLIKFLVKTNLMDEPIIT